MRTITLSRDGDIFCIVDDEDYDWLIQWKWCLYDWKKVQYARRTATIDGREVTWYMHREIAKKYIKGRSLKKCLVDHKDSNGLNNRRDNLRWVSPRQNRHNQNGARWRHMTDL